MTIRTLLLAVLVAIPASVAAHDHGKGHAAHAAHAPATTPAPALDFDRLDTDRDGFIVVSDLPAGHPALAHFSMADRDGDKRLDRDEFAVLLKML
ncbi:hypothetical protein LDO31_08200 [Luteimonas sp. XNQY3]|nr:hypothetical protein [Luteimonas sp. XNQY3]MCD9006215.1 hypothetical protein [Luteimonas sp. XNQY3]